MIKKKDENRLTQKEIKPYRLAQLERQEGICPLCLTEILPEESALDHCHKTGEVRLVLHRWCNALLGRVENWSKRQGKINNVEFLRNTVAYIEASHTDLIHPTHGKPKKRRPKAKRPKKKRASRAKK